MKKIDIIDVKNNIKNGLLSVEIHNGFILLKDTKSGEAVVIGEIPKRCLNYVRHDKYKQIYCSLNTFIFLYLI